MSTIYHYLDKTGNRFYYANRHNLMSYLFIEPNIAVIKTLSLQSTLTIADVQAMLHLFFSALIAEYQNIEYITCYPGTKSIPAAKTIVTTVESLSNMFHGDKESYLLYSNRHPVINVTEFQQTILSLEDDNSITRWCCGQNTGLSPVAFTVAVRPHISILPLIFYYILDENGYFVSEQDNPPPATVNYYIAMDLREIFQTRRIRIDENNKLHFEFKPINN